MRLRTCLALWLALGAPSAFADVSYQGEARDPDSGALLYEEHHLLLRDAQGPRERLVSYRCPDGALFARKHVRYGARPAAPAFELDDGRFGYREGVRRDGAALAAFHRPDADTPQREATLADDERLVIDAGFDEFVRAHWDALARGETLPLRFAVPSRLDTLGFKLRRIATATIDGEAASTFRLSLGGLVGFFAPDIEVGYRDRDRRLMRFEGLTNIRADRDDNLVARIEFPPTRERDGIAPGAWDAARSEVLGACEPGR